MVLHLETQNKSMALKLKNTFSGRPEGGHCKDPTYPLSSVSPTPLDDIEPTASLRERKTTPCGRYADQRLYR